MNKWGIRLVGVLMVLVFMMVMLTLYRQLVALQQSQQPAATSTSNRLSSPPCPASS